MVDASVSFKVDSSGAVTPLKQIGDQFNKTGKEAGEAGKQVDLFNDELRDTADASGKAKPVIEGAGKAIEEAGRKADKAEKQVDKLTDEIEQNTRETNENRLAVDRHGDELDDNSRDLNQNTRATDKNTGSKRRNKQASIEAANASDSMNGRMVVLGQGLSRVAGVGASVTAGFYGFSRAIGAIIGPAASFEQAMANVEAVTGATNSEMELLEKSIYRARKGLNISPTEAANAQLFLAMAGLNPQQVSAALRPALEMSIAGNLGAGQTADFLTNIAGGFGYGVDQYQRVADVSVFGSTVANTDVVQLASALTNVAGGAASAGLELEQVTAALGVFANRGIQGSRAGVMLRQMLVNLAKPTGDAKKVIEELGLSIDDLDVAEIGLVGVFDKLKEAGIERNQILRLFDTRVTEGAFAFLSATEEWNGILEQIKENAEGAASTITETKLDVLIEQWGILKADAAEFSGHVSDSFMLLEGMSALTQGAQGVFGVFNKLFTTDDVISDVIGQDSLNRNALVKTEGNLSSVESQLEQAYTGRRIAQEQLESIRTKEGVLPGIRARIIANRESDISRYNESINRLEKRRTELSDTAASQRAAISTSATTVDTADTADTGFTMDADVKAEILGNVQDSINKEVKKLKWPEEFFDSIGSTTEDFRYMLTNSFDGMYNTLLDNTKDFGDVLENAFGNIFYNIGHDLFTKYISEPLSDFAVEWLPKIFGSFEGGGDTRKGPRTGGLDGKGGYLAMVHPQERIVDLTDTANGGQVSTVVNVTQNMDFTNADDSTVARLNEAIPLIAEAASVKVKQELASGGDLYRFTSGVR